MNKGKNARSPVIRTGSGSFLNWILSRFRYNSANLYKFAFGLCMLAINHTKVVYFVAPYSRDGRDRVSPKLCACRTFLADTSGNCKYPSAERKEKSNAFPLYNKCAAICIGLLVFPHLLALPVIRFILYFSLVGRNSRASNQLLPYTWVHALETTLWPYKNVNVIAIAVDYLTQLLFSFAACFGCECGFCCAGQRIN